MKKLLFLLITILGLISTPSAYIEDKGAWDGSETNADNWSKWSVVDEYPEASVRRTVWIPVDKWKPGVEDKTKHDNPTKECTAENGSTCSVWSPDGVKIIWNRGESHENPKVCGDFRQGNYNSKNEGCKCTEDFQRPTSYCGKTGTPAYKSCGTVDSDYCDGRIYTVQCYWYKCGQWEGGGSSHSCPGGESSSDQGCGEKSRHYYAKESDTFKDETDSKNCKPSLDAAGGYAKKTYIYSYPLDFYIEFNGNGAQGTCDFKQGLNKYSNASNIEYYKGNPVCESSKSVGGTMPNQTISYVNGELNHNKS